MTEKFESKPSPLSPEKIKAAHRITLQEAIQKGFDGVREFMRDVEAKTGRRLRVKEQEFLQNSIEKLGGPDQVIADEKILAAAILKNEELGRNWSRLQEYLSTIFEPELASRMVSKAQDMERRMLHDLSSGQRSTPRGRR
mgnify:CR=1 FL=1